MSAIQTFSPRTVYLGGPPGPGGSASLVDSQHQTTGTPLPGMLAERYDAGSGVLKWRAHSTSTGAAIAAFYLERSEINQDIDDAYAANEVALVRIGLRGDVFYALVPSGANIAINDQLESNGDGYLVEGTTNPVVRAIETIGAVTVATRVRVEVI